MNHAPAEPKCNSQTFLLFPGSGEEQDWRPVPAPAVKHQPPQEERSSEEDIERWDGLS